MASGESTRVCDIATRKFERKKCLTCLIVDYILFIQADVDLAPSPNEVRDTCYVNAEELKAMFNKPDLKFTPWFKLICNSMLFEWWSHLGTPALDKYKNEKEIRRM